MQNQNIIDNSGNNQQQEKVENRLVLAPRRRVFTDQEKAEQRLNSEKFEALIAQRDRNSIRYDITNVPPSSSNLSKDQAMEAFNKFLETYNSGLAVQTKPATNFFRVKTDNSVTHLVVPTFEYRETKTGDIVIMTDRGAARLLAKYKTEFGLIGSTDRELISYFTLEIKSGNPVLTANAKIPVLTKSGVIQTQIPSIGQYMIPNYVEKVLTVKRENTKLRAIFPELNDLIKMSSRGENILPNRMFDPTLPHCPVDVLLRFGGLVANQASRAVGKSAVIRAAKIIKSNFYLLPAYAEISKTPLEAVQSMQSEIHKKYFVLAITHPIFVKHLAGLPFPLIERAVSHIPPATLEDKVFEKQCKDMAITICAAAGLGNYATVTRAEQIAKNRNKINAPKIQSF